MKHHINPKSTCIAKATIHERVPGRRMRERISTPGIDPSVRAMLDPRLQLDPAQRAVGQTFGYFYEQVACGGSGPFLTEYVDGGGFSGGGHSERLAAMRQQLDVALAALGDLPPVKYRLSRPRAGAGERGEHLPIPCRRLMLEACVNGHTMTAVGMEFGWWVTRARKPGRHKSRERSDLPPETMRVVPGRQRNHLGEELRRILDEVGEAWDKRGFRPIRAFGAVEPD